MKPIVSIIMGSTSDLPVMEKAAKLLDEMQVPFEMNALSAHRTPAEVETFAKSSRTWHQGNHRGCRNGCCTAGSNCSQHHPSGYRSTCKRFCTRRCRRTLLYHPDASRNTCGYSSHQRCHECCYPGRTDAGPERCRTGSKVCSLQGKFEKQNRKSQRRAERSQIRL